MTEKRFEVGRSANQYTIFDNEGCDDYYHLGNDERDVKALCKRMNELQEDQLEEIQALKKQNKELSKTIGTLTFNYENSKSIIADCKQQSEKLVDLTEDIVELKKKNQRLKEGMLFFIHIASAKLEDRDTYCEMAFNCNYAEAKKKYGTLIEKLLEEGNHNG